MSPLEQLEQLMKDIDWNYRYSDDNSHWNRSDQMLLTISRMSAELSIDHQDEVDALWKKYNPKH